MGIYSERVEMISANRRLMLVLAAAGLLGYAMWDWDELESLPDLGREIASHWYVLLGAMTAAALAFSNQLVIELRHEALLLRAGMSYRRVALAEIRRATAVAEIKQDNSPFALLPLIGWHTDYVSQVVKTGIRISFIDDDEGENEDEDPDEDEYDFDDDEESLEFSSNNPDHLASMINDLAKQALAREPMDLGGK